MTIRTRFAPSPTGLLHVGGARTALFCYLYARHHGGVHLLRIEDTDRERSTQTSVDAILHGLEWLGIEYDEGPYYQTGRMELYRSYIDQLLREAKAYRCYCSRERLEAIRETRHRAGLKPRYDGHCRDLDPVADRPSVVRFRNPKHGEVVVNDLVHGAMVFSNQELDDLIIARSDGTPTYNFTVVVDDLSMAITHVIRGDDHINNTPRQLNILQALGATPPIYAHVSMITGADGRRLSKRHGAVGVMEFNHQGYLPEALLNYLVRLGWSHGDQEIFSRQELIALFDISEVNRAPAVFDFDKLGWLNQRYIKSTNGRQLARLLAQQLTAIGLDSESGPDLSGVVSVQRERSKTMLDMAEKSAFAYREDIELDAVAARKHLRPAAETPLRLARERLQHVADWSPDTLCAITHAIATEALIPLGKLAQPLRVALTGGAASPSIEHTLWMVGCPRSLRRIDAAIAHIQNLSVQCG